jgi:hypothetical protein
MNPRPGGARRENFPKRSITPTSEVETVNGSYKVVVHSNPSIGALEWVSTVL